VHARLLGALAEVEKVPAAQARHWLAETIPAPVWYVPPAHPVQVVTPVPVP
jgi:hypothetical protein